MHPVAAGDPADVTKNGMIGDTVLQVVAARTLAVVGTSCPALDVAVANGKAAFLRPESAGNAPDCPASPNGDLNDDGDANDAVVHFWQPGKAIANLGKAATSVVLSESHVAALVSECGTGGPVYVGCAAGGTDLNQDGDAADTVVAVRPLCDDCEWVFPTHDGRAQAATSLAISGSIVAFLTPEAAEGGAMLNADHDATDTVVQVYDAAMHETLLAAVGERCRRRRPRISLVLGGSRPDKSSSRFAPRSARRVGSVTWLPGRRHRFERRPRRRRRRGASLQRRGRSAREQRLGGHALHARVDATRTSRIGSARTR